MKQKELKKMSKLRRPKKTQKRIAARIEDYQRSVAHLEALKSGSSKSFKKPGSCKKS